MISFAASLVPSVNATVLCDDATSTAFLPFVLAESWHVQQSQNRCHGAKRKESSIPPFPCSWSCRGRGAKQGLTQYKPKSYKVNWGLWIKHAIRKKVVSRGGQRKDVSSGMFRWMEESQEFCFTSSKFIKWQQAFFLHRSETNLNLTAALHKGTTTRFHVSVLAVCFFQFLGIMSHFQLITGKHKVGKQRQFLCLLEICSVLHHTHHI